MVIRFAAQDDRSFNHADFTSDRQGGDILEDVPALSEPARSPALPGAAAAAKVMDQARIPRLGGVSRRAAA